MSVSSLPPPQDETISNLQLELQQLRSSYEAQLAMREGEVVALRETVQNRGVCHRNKPLVSESDRVLLLSFGSSGCFQWRSSGPAAGFHL